MRGRRSWPNPIPTAPAPGQHVHVSLIDRSGRNVFDNGTPEGSEALRFAAGGLAALMPESMAFFAPNLNAYRRFQPDMFAPVNRRWGINNRSAGLRVPVGPERSAPHRTPLRRRGRQSLSRHGRDARRHPSWAGASHRSWSAGAAAMFRESPIRRCHSRSNARWRFWRRRSVLPDYFGRRRGDALSRDQSAGAIAVPEDHQRRRIRLVSVKKGEERALLSPYSDQVRLSGAC